MEATASFAALGLTPTQDSLYVCDRATKDNVQQLSKHGTLAQYRYVLFGTHAVLPENVAGLTQPEIVLARPRAWNDYLTMSDVLGLSFNADAIILSACKSGGGTLTAGEGIEGLTQAFMYAGTPIVGVTDWKLIDSIQIQEKLTPEFFKAMSGGQTAAKALQQAKLALIRSDNPLESAPYFWAPMVIFGDGDASVVRTR